MVRRTRCSGVHYWIPQTTNKSGNAAFRKNKKVDQVEPVVRVHCRDCGHASWYSKSAWQKLPASKKEGE